ncbi:hypothetical protein C5167_041447 [Papaver somniferum]|nr:hypothetical protein C5167_041447 [Papaver somniferum]
MLRGPPEEHCTINTLYPGGRSRNYLIHKNLLFNNSISVKNAGATADPIYPTSPSVTTKSDSTADASPATVAATFFSFTG